MKDKGIKRVSFSDDAEKSSDSSDDQNKSKKKKSNTKSTTNGNALEWFDGGSEQESYDGNKIKSIDNKAKEKLAIQLIRNGMCSVSKEEKKKIVDKEESDVEEIEVVKESKNTNKYKSYQSVVPKDGIDAIFTSIIFSKKEIMILEESGIKGKMDDWVECIQQKYFHRKKRLSSVPVGNNNELLMKQIESLEKRKITLTKQINPLITDIKAKEKELEVMEKENYELKMKCKTVCAGKMKLLQGENSKLKDQTECQNKNGDVDTKPDNNSDENGIKTNNEDYQNIIKDYAQKLNEISKEKSKLLKLNDSLQLENKEKSQQIQEMENLSMTNLELSEKLQLAERLLKQKQSKKGKSDSLEEDQVTKTAKITTTSTTTTNNNNTVPIKPMLNGNKK